MSYVVRESFEHRGSQQCLCVSPNEAIFAVYGGRYQRLLFGIHPQPHSGSGYPSMLEY